MAYVRVGEIHVVEVQLEDLSLVAASRAHREELLL